MNSEEILPSDLDKMIKPYAYIILPSLIAEDVDKTEYLSDLVYSLREFNFKTSEDIVITESEPNGIPDKQEGPEGHTGLKKKIPKLNAVLNKLENEYEDTFLASLSNLADKLNYLKSLY